MPIHLAAKKGSNEIIQLLINIDAELVKARDLKDNIALHYAAYNNHLVTSEILINNGASVNAKDIHNNTPLHYAVLNNNNAAAAVLLSNNADLYQQNNDFITPWQIAFYNENNEIKELLNSAMNTFTY